MAGASVAVIPKRTRPTGRLEGGSWVLITLNLRSSGFYLGTCSFFLGMSDLQVFLGKFTAARFALYVATLVSA